MHLYCSFIFIEPLSIGVDLFGNTLWHKAMVTLNINWHHYTSSISTVGEYFILDRQVLSE